MPRRPSAAAAGERLHLSHGPIDVVLKACVPMPFAQPRPPAGASGNPAGAVRRSPCRTPMTSPRADGPVARRMLAAWSFADVFVAPMAGGRRWPTSCWQHDAAASLGASSSATRGDIAVLVAPDQTRQRRRRRVLRGATPLLNGAIRIDATSGIGGIATSGARGRSFSLGIADAVTTLARDAATADVAATLVANAVNVDSPAIRRRPARELDPDSDLRDLPVTVSVGPLTSAEIDAALANGEGRALDYRRRGLIVDAALMLAGRSRMLGTTRSSEPAAEVYLAACFGRSHEQLDRR
jgi:ApbE superfamily uncharacterized protein (UPF0280 family)